MDIKDLVDELSEAGVIASLIYKPELCYHDEDLSERHFNDPINSIIFYAIKEMVKKNIYKVDAINILSMISEGNKRIEKMSKTANITSETICVDSGAVAGKNGECPRTAIQFYIAGSEPGKFCHLHVKNQQ